MRGRYKPKDPTDRNDEAADIGAGLSPLSGEPAAGSAEPHTPVHGFTVPNVGGSKKGRTTFQATGLNMFTKFGQWKCFVAGRLLNNTTDVGWTTNLVEDA